MDKIIDQEEEFTDYPYIGLGKKPFNKKNYIDDEQLEKTTL